MIGSHMLAGIGTNAATELELKIPETCSGHCFHWLSAIVANSAANAVHLTHHFGWQEKATALNYINETIERVTTRDGSNSGARRW